MRLSLHIWVLVIVCLIALGYAVSRKNKVSKKRCVFLITVVLTLFSGLRSWKMGDVYHYYYAFLQCNSESWHLDFTSHDSVGTQILYRIIGQLHLDFGVCLFLIAAFSAISLGVFVYRYSTSPYLSYLIYIGLGSYIFTLSGLKQTIAMAFVMWAMMAVIESKPKRFLVFTALGALFHLPACIFLVAYFAAHKKIDGLYFAGLVAIAVLVMVFRDQIVEKMAALYYEDELKFNASEGIGGKFIILLAILVFSIVIHPLTDNNKTYRYLFNIMVLAAILQSFSAYDNVFTRLADYYFQFFSFFVPLVLNSRTEYVSDGTQCCGYRIPRTLRMMGVAAITVLAAIIYVQTLNASTDLLSEFSFLWENR